MVKEFLFNSITGGILWLIIGTLMMFYTLKFVNREPTSVGQPFLNALFSSIGFITLGLIMIITKIKELFH